MYEHRKHCIKFEITGRVHEIDSVNLQFNIKHSSQYYPDCL